MTRGHRVHKRLLTLTRRGSWSSTGLSGSTSERSRTMVGGGRGAWMATPWASLSRFRNTPGDKATRAAGAQTAPSCPRGCTAWLREIWDSPDTGRQLMSLLSARSALLLGSWDPGHISETHEEWPLLTPFLSTAGPHPGGQKTHHSALGYARPSPVCPLRDALSLAQGIGREERRQLPTTAGIHMTGGPAPKHPAWVFHLLITEEPHHMALDHQTLGLHPGTAMY